MRRFILQRHEDLTGVSGTGRVVEGIQFSDGRCAYRWVTRDTPRTTVVADRIEDIVQVHGHDGKTELVWLDEEEGPEYEQRQADSEQAYRANLHHLSTFDRRQSRTRGPDGSGNNVRDIRYG